MRKKLKILFPACSILFLIVLTAVLVRAEYYVSCPNLGGLCDGMCRCLVEEGEHEGGWGGDPCCFSCSHWSGPIVCCQGISPSDGCLTPRI